jgi:DNA repair photolyase
MKINEIKCKTALSKSNLPGLDYSLNPYKGCQHSCCYCYVPNILRLKRENWGNFVDVKTNIPVVLANELKKKKPGIVALSTVTDPYQPVENKYKLTRYCLEQLLIRDFPVHIQTKSDLVLRDIDLISKFSDVEVMFSIGTLDDSERKTLEPFSSPIQKRLDAMKEIFDIGIKTSVFFGPIYPTIRKQDLPNIINTFVEFGAKEIMVDKFNLKPGILQVLEEKIPRDIELIKDTSYFKEMYGEINQICKKKNIDAILAFD